MFVKFNYLHSFSKPIVFHLDQIEYNLINRTQISSSTSLLILIIYRTTFQPIVSHYNTVELQLDH
jgi:hypothetical protein